MGKKEEEFRKRIAEQNTTGFSGLLGRYSEEEQEFIKETNKESNLTTKSGIIPKEEEMKNYVKQSLDLMFGVQQDEER